MARVSIGCMVAVMLVASVEWAAAAGASKQVVIIGDSLADGLWAGLHRLTYQDAAVEVVKRSRLNTGIARYDRYDWSAAAAEIAVEAPYDVALLMFGANDAQTIREGGRAHHYQTAGWVTAYKRRIDEIIEAMSHSIDSVYWVGLPIAKKKFHREVYAYLNGIFRERCKVHGIPYIDTWSKFAGDAGEFTASGPDRNGRKTVLRASDGVHFTPVGYERLAAYVLAEIGETTVGAALAK